MKPIAQSLKLGAGNETGIYFVRPEGNAVVPAILLFPAIAGVNDYIRRTADRLAARGYAVAALDYYSREGQAPDISSADKIREAAAALSDSRTLGDARQVVEFFRGQPDIRADKIAALGFCIGGNYALQAGCKNLNLSACVDFYGAIKYKTITTNKPISPLDRVPDLTAPLLCHFGDADRSISSDDVHELTQALYQHQKNYELFRYAGAPHAFDEDFRRLIYRPAAASDAWRRTNAFLSYYLDGRATR